MSRNQSVRIVDTIHKKPSFYQLNFKQTHNHIIKDLLLFTAYTYFSL